MSQSTLPLSNVVDVTVQISPQAVAPPSFNKYLIVGTSTHIPTAIRTVAFSGGTSILQQMLSYGFVDTDPEYKAAAQYLAASSNHYFLTIGRQDLTASETCLQAVEACRIVDPTWYLFTALAADDTANIALSEWAQTASPVSQIFWSTSSADTLTGVGDIFTTLKAGNYNRYQGVYATTQSGAAPNNAYLHRRLLVWQWA